MWWIAAAATALNVSPVYLRCEFAEPSGNWSVDLAVDEANQRIGIGRPNVPPTNLSALFTPDRVIASEPVGAETMTWTISRTDLTVSTTTSFSPRRSTGACKLQPIPAKRAF